MKYLRIFICTFLFFSLSCKKNNIPDVDFRQEMRNFIENISTYARSYSNGFIVIPQNGQELITFNGEVSGLQTGFKVSFLPYKLCPFLFGPSALLIFFGVIL